MVPLSTAISLNRSVFIKCQLYFFKSSTNLEQKTTGVKGIGKCLPLGNPSQNVVSLESDTLHKADNTD